jgi:putative alpha-1,2-mannosidase
MSAIYEGTAWIYSYGVLHDLDGLVEAMGGRVRFNERLNHALDAGLIDITNEPSFRHALAVPQSRPRRSVVLLGGARCSSTSPTPPIQATRTPGP